MDYWRLCESMNIYQAAALIVGASPSGVMDNGNPYLRVADYFENQYEFDPHFQAAVVALKAAIQRRRLKAVIWHQAVKFTEFVGRYREGWASRLDTADCGGADYGEPVDFDPAIDWYQTSIDVEDLRAWLASRGFTTGFFFPDPEEGQVGYLDRNHLNYAPKLAAAIRAWEAVTSDPERLRGKTPKQAITKWLNEHAAAYGLTKDDGTPNATGVEEAAKLANWKPEGGASKTPGE